ncbi:MAG TPA: heavy-metal-associated domain-containing protein [Lutibacter sp.]|nr:heavy-metal-associated domain-containing protein [Lutibacter sp.]
MNTLFIQNLKCHGCANTITKGIKSIQGVTEVKVNVDDSNVSFKSINSELITQVKAKLSKMGYPEQDATNTTIHKAKSYVSCAIGKLNE